MAETTQAKVDAWLVGAPGRSMNPDHAFGLQCVDVIDDYGQSIYGKPWTQTVGAVNGAKDLLNRMPSEYWTRVVNDSNKSDLVPRKGDVIVYPGRIGNAWMGHTGVVVSADQKGVTIIEQNGWTNKPAQKAYHSYASYLPLGWLRPKIAAEPKKQAKPTRKAKKGVAKVVATALNVRNSPSTSAKIVATYKKGQTFNYDSYIDAGGYRWLSYVSFSGERRYVAQAAGKTKYVSGGV